MIKKSLTILFLFCLCGALHPQNYWLRSSFSPNLTLNKIAFTDSTTFFIAADSGKILYTSNAGTNWSIRSTGLLSNIIDITFVNANTGFALSWEFGQANPNFVGTIILKTTNAGVNWINDYKTDTAAFYSKIIFTDVNHGFLAGQPVTLQRTSDAGDTWHEENIDSSNFSTYPARNIKFSGNVGIACGGWIDIQGVVWRTTNGGSSWKAQGIGPEPLFDIHFYDENHIIVVGGDFEYGASMGSSTDGGANWNYITFEQFGTAHSMSYRTNSEGWIVLGIGQKFLYTMNGGSSWLPFAAPNGEILYDVKFASRRNGIAVGSNGAILKFNTDYVGISNYNSALPDNFELKQNYPNPFNPGTVISFKLEKPEFVTLKIYDMLGKEIKTLIEGMKIPGEHKINFTAADIPAGVYYYTLSSKSFSQTKKMVLIK